MNMDRDSSGRYLVSALPQQETAELCRLMAEEIKECAFFLMDTNGIIRVWNKAAEEMKGYTAADAIGQYFGFLYTDQERKRGLPERNLKIAAKDGFFTEETWRKRKDGSLFWARIAMTALHDATGALRGFSKITLDLTQHMLLEQCVKEREEIARILRAVDAGTWKWNTRANEVDMSQHFLALLGHAGNDSRLRLDDWLQLMHPADAVSLARQLDGVCEGRPDSHLAAQVRMRLVSGAYHWFYVRGDWPHDGLLDTLMGVSVDIQNLKVAENERERLFHELQDERSRFSDILEQMPSAVLLAEAPSGKLIYLNRAAVELFGPSRAGSESIHQFARGRFLNQQNQRVSADELPLARAVAQGETTRGEDLTHEQEDGTLTHFSVTAAPIVDRDGIARLAVAVLHDVSNIKEAQFSLAAEKERAQVTLAAITDGVISTDLDGRIAMLNPAAERLIGMCQADALGRPVNEVVHLIDDASKLPILDPETRWQQNPDAPRETVHATLMGRDGRQYSVESAAAPIRLADDRSIGTVLVFHDVTEARQLMHQLHFEASHDALTGLVNRREFEARLRRTMERIRRFPDNPAALLYMDLDQFKIVNDTCGHVAGDELLRSLAQIYREHVRERDTLARLGGDEFALIAEHCTMDEAIAVAEKLLDATRDFRYSCKDRFFRLGVSIGLIPLDQSASSVEQALRQADHACYIAKETGRNRVYVQDRDDGEMAQRRNDMYWVTRMKEAFRNDALQLYCQPIVPIGVSDACLHYEILLRLKNGPDDPIVPGAFLPAAERYDVMPEVDRWVLRKSLEWLQANPAHLAKLQICTINLSRRTLADQSFLRFASDLLDASDVPAEKLCFEITENGAISNIQRTLSFISSLAERGCKFSLDDFGSGMTSFTNLKELPVDFIKIDGSFIQQMVGNPIDYEMVRFTNEISHMMGRQTIAEYVTDQIILDELREIGIDFAQGYWLGKPRPLSA